MPSRTPPSLLLVAGPNGSGKSTISAALVTSLFAGVEIVDPDAAPVGGPIAAARSSIAAVDTAIDRRMSIVVETTLAGTRALRVIRRARLMGYRTSLFYICAEPVGINIERVAQRVRHGGHDVPEGDIRRRYERSLKRLPTVVELVDEFTLLDNSTTRGPVVVAHGAFGRTLHRAKHVPDWARHII